MTPKEKAKELFEKMDFKHQSGFGLPISMYKSQRKQCAQLAVLHILDATKIYSILDDGSKLYHYSDYWQEVRQEIEKL